MWWVAVYITLSIDDTDQHQHGIVCEALQPNKCACFISCIGTYIYKLKYIRLEKAHRSGEAIQAQRLCTHDMQLSYIYVLS